MCNASSIGVGAVIAKVLKMDQSSLQHSYLLHQQHRYHFWCENVQPVFTLQRFEIFKDQNQLIYLFGEYKGIPTLFTCRIQQWSFILGSYNYSVKYHPGKEIGNANRLTISCIIRHIILTSSRVNISSELFGTHIINAIHQMALRERSGVIVTCIYSTWRLTKKLKWISLEQSK